jgi:hypothetical protein
MQQPGHQPLFQPGRTVGTPGALAALDKAGQSPQEFLARHIRGDWGDDLCEKDREENQVSLERGFRLLSSYRTCADEEIWVLTEADRSVTTILLPEEY